MAFGVSAEGGEDNWGLACIVELGGAIFTLESDEGSRRDDDEDKREV